MSDTESSDGEVDFRPTVDIDSLPQCVQGRVKALKNLQHDAVKAEADYFREVHQLDLKYKVTFDKLYAKRTQIISGGYEPSGAELEWTDKNSEENGDADEEIANGVGKITIQDLDENTKGIPKFWMYVLKNANEESLMGLVEPHDEPVLEYLTDITADLSAPTNSGFTLKFHFSENPYFTNTVLTKEYALREDPESDDPLQYDGPEIVSCKGCSIDWKEGKDVTKTTITVKKLKSKKSKGSPDKRVTKEIKADSFFNFFNPPEIPEGKEAEMKEEHAATLAVDFDVGFAIREKIIPRAVLYFTGEIYDEDDDDYEDEEESDEEGDTEEEGDN